MQNWLTEQTLFLIFAGVCVAAFSIQYWWLRQVGLARLSWLVWALAALFLGVGWRLSEQAGQRERNRIQNVMEDFARLYGDEMEKRGHWKLPSNVVGDDPLYLNLVETEKNWEKLNPDVSDIYTLRKLPNGKNVFIVDSETDYNRNGVYDGEREQRTPVGEVYNEVDVGLERAFRGQANFDFIPITDRWGTWVSAYVPLRDPSGLVEAAMGVDFDARKFITTIANAKLRIISIVAFLQLVLLGASTLNFVLRAQIVERKKAEASLQRQQIELRALLDFIPAMICFKDTEDGILKVNKRLAETVGKLVTEIEGKPAREIFPQEATRNYADDLEVIRSGAPRLGIIKTVRDRDGKEIYIETNKIPVCDKDGKVIGIVVMSQDITERERAKTELLESKHFLQSTLDALSSQIAILDTQGIIVEVNAAWTRFASENNFLGSNRGVGDNYLQLCDSAAGGFSKEAAVAANGIRAVMAGQRDEFNLEYPCHSPEEQRWFVVRVTSFNGEGSVWVVVAHENITARKQAEAALVEAGVLLEALLQNTTDRIYFKDRQSRFVHFSRAILEIFRLTKPVNLKGKTDFDFFSEEQARLAFEADQEIIRSGKPVVNLEEKNTHLDGRVSWVLTSKMPWRDEAGNVVGTIGISRDITERKRLEAQLFQSQKMETIGKLAGGVAHEFNSILTAIIGQSELLLGDLPAGSPLVKNATEIIQAAGRAAALTRQLLAYGRKQFLQPETLNLNQVITSMAGIFHLLMGDKVDTKIIPATNLQTVQADAGQIEQVIMNIVINARDAMPNGGKLTLETANVTFDLESVGRYPELKPGDYVMLAITDNGRGMSEEVRARVFEPFFSTKGVGQGTGLGLSTCYGIIRQSSGYISVYSESGQGTTFKIYLPQVESSAKISLGQLSAPELPHGTETILLVEDDAALREMAAMLLRRLGYTVLAAANGIEALILKNQYDIGHIDLLFTDVVMPHMSGKELADRVQALRPHTKILFTSAYTENAIAHQGVLNQGVALLQKPFTPAALARKLRDVLDQPAAPAPDSAQTIAASRKI